MQFAGQARGFHRPGKIRGFDLAIANGAGDSKAGDIGTKRLLGDELAHDLIEPAVVAAGKDALRDGSEIAILRLKEGEPCVRASDIAGENHFSKFLQRRPSRSRSSSASRGPQVPDA